MDITISTNKKNIFVGAGASGKDFAKKICRENKNIVCDVSYTTRPKRSNEIAGVDYIYVTKEEFEQMIRDGLFIQFNLFGNGHYYGTTKKSWESSNLFIMTPNVIETVMLEHGEEEIMNEDVTIYFFNISENIRKERLEQRDGDGDSVERRLQTDREDFADFSRFNYEITNPEFSISVID